VDSRADIYSLGVVLYEMLTGQLPANAIEPPSRKVHVDVRIDEIVLRALEKTPELRFQTAAEFRATLADVTATSTRLGFRVRPKRLPSNSNHYGCASFARRSSWQVSRPDCFCC
jgi:serine/threonine protein kinase